MVVADMQEEQRDLRMQNVMLKEEVEDLKRQLNRAQQHINAANTATNHVACHARQQELLETIAALETELHSAKISVATISTTVSKSQPQMPCVECEKTAQSKRALQLDLDLLQRKFTAATEKHTVEVTRYEKTLDALRKSSSFGGENTDMEADRLALSRLSTQLREVREAALAERDRLQRDHLAEMNLLRSTHERAIAELRAEHSRYCDESAQRHAQEVSSLNSRLQIVTAEREALQSALRRQETLMATASASASTSVSDVELARAELRRQMEMELALLRDQLQAAQSRAADLEAQLSQRNGELAARTRALHGLEVQCTEKDDTIATLRRQHTEAISKAGSEREAASRRFEESETAFAALRLEVARHLAAAQEAQSREAAQVARIELLSGQVEKGKKSLETTLVQHEEELQRRDYMHREASERAQQQIQRVEALLDERAAEAAELRRQIATILEPRIANLSSEMEQIRTRAAISEEQGQQNLQHSQENVRKLELALQDARGELELRVNEVRSLQGTVDSVHQKLRQMTKELEQSSEEIKSQSIKHNQLREASEQELDRLRRLQMEKETALEASAKELQLTRTKLTQLEKEQKAIIERERKLWEETLAAVNLEWTEKERNWQRLIRDLHSAKDQAILDVEQQYTKKMHDLEVKVQSLDNEIQRKDLQIHGLKQQLQNVTEERDRAFENLQSTLAENEKMLKAVKLANKEEVTALKENIVTIEIELAATKQSLKDKESAWQSKALELTADGERALKEKEVTMNSRLSDVQKQLEEAMNTHIELRRQTTQLQSQLSSREAEVGGLQGKVESHVSLLETTKRDHAANIKQVEALLANKTQQMEQRHEEYNRDIQSLRKQIADLEAQIEAGHAGLREKEKTWQASLQQQQAEASGRERSLKEQLQVQRSEAEEQEKAMLAQVLQLRAEIEQLMSNQTRSRSVEIDVAQGELRRQIAELQSSLHGRESEVAGLQSKLAAQLQLYETLKEQQGAAVKQLEGMLEDKERLVATSKATYEREIQESRVRVTELEKEVNALRQSLKDKESAWQGRMNELMGDHERVLIGKDKVVKERDLSMIEKEKSYSLRVRELEGLLFSREGELSTLKLQLESQLSVVLSVKREADVTKKELDELLQSKTNLLEQTRAEFEGRDRDRLARIRALEDELNTLRPEMRAAQESIVSQTRVIEETLKKQLYDESKSLRELQTRALELEQEIQQYKLKMAASEKLQDELRLAANMNSKELSDVRGQLKQKEEEIKDLRGQLSGKRLKVAALQIQDTSIKSRAERVEHSLNVQRQQHDDMEKEVRERMKGLEEQRSQAEQELLHQLHDEQATVARLQGEMLEVRAECDRRVQQMIEQNTQTLLEREIHFKQEVDSALSKATVLQEAYDKLMRDYEAFKVHARASQGEQLEYLAKEYEKVKAENADLHQKLAELNQQIMECEKRIHLLSLENGQLQDALHREKIASADALRKAQEESDLAMSNLEKLLEETQESKHRDMCQKIESEKIKVEELQVTVLNLQEDLTSADNRLASLRSQHDREMEELLKRMQEQTDERIKQLKDRHHEEDEERSAQYLQEIAELKRVLNQRLTTTITTVTREKTSSSHSS